MTRLIIFVIDTLLQTSDMSNFTFLIAHSLGQFLWCKCFFSLSSVLFFLLRYMYVQLEFTVDNNSKVCTLHYHIQRWTYRINVYCPLSKLLLIRIIYIESLLCIFWLVTLPYLLFLWSGLLLVIICVLLC